MQIDESNERASQRKSGWQTSPDYFPERPRTTVIYRRRPESSKAMKKSTWGRPMSSQHWRVPSPGFANKCFFLRDSPPRWSQNTNNHWRAALPDGFPFSRRRSHLPPGGLPGRFAYIFISCCHLFIPSLLHPFFHFNIVVHFYIVSKLFLTSLS